MSILTIDTSSSFSSMWRMKLDPMNPQPPVTTIRCIMFRVSQGGRERSAISARINLGTTSRSRSRGVDHSNGPLNTIANRYAISTSGGLTCDTGPMPLAHRTVAVWPSFPPIVPEKSPQRSIQVHRKSLEKTPSACSSTPVPNRFKDLGFQGILVISEQAAKVRHGGNGDSVRL